MTGCDGLEKLARLDPAVQHDLNRTLARDIARRQAAMMMLGTMNAEQRMAAFLIDLSQRYLALGYSQTEFVLRLTREEIGSYLGLALETTSRLLSRFHREGLIELNGRAVKLLDLASLKKLFGL